MNWKVIVGILVILGGIKEFFAELKDSQTGVTEGSPIYAQLGCITLIGLGFYLIYKGRQPKKLK
jgi:LPXTG-motif cell wall-anchored protein